MSSVHRLPRAALLFGTVLGACGGASDSPTTPSRPTTPTPTLPLTIESGASVADSILTRLSAPLEVALRTSAGAARPGVAIRFDALPPSDSTRLAERAIVVAPPATQLFAGSVIDTTDAQGRAAVLVQLGTVAGSSGIVITTPDGLSDTARFTVLPGNAVSLIAPIHDTTLYQGESFSLGASLRDQFKNARSELPTVSLTQLVDASVSVDGSDRVSATAAFGRAKLELAGAGRSDSVFVSVVPVGTLAVTNGYPEIVDLDGKNARTLTNLATDLFLFAAFPDWAPDGSTIAVDAESNVGDAGLVTMDTLGAYQFAVPLIYPFIVGPGHYSADGLWLYYSRAEALSGRVELWRVHPDGTGADSLFTAAPGQVAWTDPRPSPDGRYVFVTGFDGSNRQAARLDLVAGTELRYPGNYCDPAYSPVADLVAMETATAQLVVAKSDGSQLRALTAPLSQSAGDGHQSFPSWSPDGKWLVARDDSLARLVIVRVSDGAIVPILAGRDGAAAWRPR